MTFPNSGNAMKKGRTWDFRRIVLSCTTIVTIATAAMIPTAYAEDQTHVGNGGSVAETPVPNPGAGAASIDGIPISNHAIASAIAAVADALATADALAAADADSDTIASAHTAVDTAIDTANAVVDAAITAVAEALTAKIATEALAANAAEPSPECLLTTSNWAKCFGNVALNTDWYVDVVAPESPPKFWKLRSLP